VIFMKTAGLCISVLLSLNCLPLSAAPVNTESPITIESGGYQNGDVTFQPAIPLQNQEVAFLVQVHNRGSSDTDTLTVVLQGKDGGSVLDETTTKIAANASSLVRLKWKPTVNGWQTLQVRVLDKNRTELLIKTVTIPVVARPVYFAWATKLPTAEHDKKLKYVNIIQVWKPTWEENLQWLEYWERRGVRPVQWKQGYFASMNAEQYKQYLKEGYDKRTMPDSKSIWIDEIGGYSDYDHPVAEWTTDHLFTESIKGLVQFNQENPTTWTGVWIFRPLLPSFSQLAKSRNRTNGVDLLLCETYVNYKVTSQHNYDPYVFFDYDIDTARRQNVIYNTLLTLGTGNLEKYVVTTPGLEEQVRHIRTNAPEIPGIGFFTSSERDEIVEFCDDLCRKYWIEPVLNVWGRDILFSSFNPRAGEEIRITASIFNIGGMDAKDIQVAFYQDDPRYGGKQIGEIHRLPVVSPSHGWSDGRVDVVQTWKSEKGNHDIFVTATTEEGHVTLLNTSASKSVYVQ